MSDVAIGEALPELAPPVPPGPEPEAAAVEGLAPVADQGVAAPTEFAPAVDEVSSEVPSADAPAERALPFADVEHLGVLRRAVLDALVDADEPLSVARIIAEMPVGTSRGSAESAIKREFDAGRIERVSAGHYVLAKPKPPEPKPAPLLEPVRADGISDEQWLTWLHEWRATSRWEGPGNPPGQAGCLVPLGVVSRHNDRIRKREERRKEREAAAAERTAADRALRDQLLVAANGNFQPGPGLDDVGPIREVLKVLPLDRVVMVVRQKVDRRCFPGNPPLTSWRDPIFLQALAEDFCRAFAVPGLVKEWGAAGRAPAPTVPSSPPGDMPDDNVDRSRHDAEHAPAGPHNLAQLDATQDMLQEAASASEPPAAISAPASIAGRPPLGFCPFSGETVSSTITEENAPASPPPQAHRDPGTAEDASPDTVAEPASDQPDSTAPEVAAVPAAPPDDGRPVTAGRAAVLAAFARNRTPPSPQPAPPPARPAERPWFAGERQAAPAEREMTDEGWEELIAGFVAGNVNWNRRRLGGEPGSQDCRAPRSVLRRFGL
jgi:hypothetical protein